MRNLFKIFLLLVCFNSCASSYKLTGPSYEKRTWRICSLEMDKPELNRKGFCYVEKWCKDQLFGKKCKNEQLHCAWGDLVCMEKYKLFDKRLR